MIQCLWVPGQKLNNSPYARRLRITDEHRVCVSYEVFHLTLKKKNNNVVSTDQHDSGSDCDGVGMVPQWCGVSCVGQLL